MSMINKDLIQDIKSEFIEYMYEFHNCDIATKKILSNYEEELDDNNDAIAIWIGLSITQWTCGLLQPEIKASTEKEIYIKIEQYKEANNFKDIAYLEKIIAKITKIEITFFIFYNLSFF